MSTNATATIYSEFNDEPICTIYKHWDGYIQRFGEDLREFAASRKVVNGLSLSTDHGPVANGMGCFAAQLIAHLKESPGDVYIASINTAGSEQYNYRIRLRDDQVVVTCDEEGEW